MFNYSIESRIQVADSVLWQSMEDDAIVSYTGEVCSISANRTEADILVLSFKATNKETHIPEKHVGDIATARMQDLKPISLHGRK